jgi:WD40 repeat protein
MRNFKSILAFWLNFVCICSFVVQSNAQSKPIAGLSPKLIPPVGHTFGVHDAEFSPDEKYILTAGDRTAKVWEVSTGKLIHNLTGHWRKVKNAHYTPDGRYIVTRQENNDVKIWDPLTGENIFDIDGYYTEYEKAIRFNPNGKQITVLKDSSSVAVWDLDMQKEVFTLSGLFPEIWTIGFNAEGSQIITTSTSGIMKTWDATTGRNILNIKAHRDLCRARFSPDGKTIVSGSLDKTIKIWKSKNGHLNKEITGFENGLNIVNFMPDGKQLLIFTMGGKVSSRKVANSKLIYSIPWISRLWFAEHPFGKQVAMANDNQIGIWNAISGKELFMLNTKVLVGKEIQDATKMDSVDIIKYSPDGAKFAAKVSSYNPQSPREIISTSVNIWDSRTGDLLNIFQDEKHRITFMEFSKNGKYVITVSKNYFIQLWDANSGQLIHNLTGHIFPVEKFSLDSNKVRIWRDNQSNIFEFSKKEGSDITWPQEKQSGQDIVFNEIFVEEEPAEPIEIDGNNDFEHEIIALTPTIAASVGIAPPLFMLYDSVKGMKIPIGAMFIGNQIQLHDYDTWDSIATLSGHTDEVVQILMDSLNNWIVSASYDGSLKFWNSSTYQEILSYYPVDSNNWVVTHPSGLFDASPEAMELMYFTIGPEIIELEQLKDRYYEPGLYTKTLFGDNSLRNVAELGNVRLYPLAKASIKGSMLNIDLHERNGGIGAVSIFADDKRIIADANPERKKQLRINLLDYRKHFIADTINYIFIRTFNEEGWLKSSKIGVEYSPVLVNTRGDEGPQVISLGPKKAKPHFYGLVVGTSDYNGTKLDLKFSDEDALAISTAMNQAAAALFGQNFTHVQRLSTEAGSTKRPTKKNIKLAFDHIANVSKPSDVLLIYMSGHGLSYGDVEKEQFYYLTTDVSSGDLSDPAVREKYAISTDDLTNWLTGIAAKKQVMIIDACSSGKVIEDLSSTRDVPSSQIRAIDRMKDRTGMFVLAGSAADKVSYEASQYGQGLLTYSILSGMSGNALKDGISVDVSRLFNFARDKVPQYAEDINGIQTPVLFSNPGASSFDIGLVDENVKIVVKDVKPIFVRSNFQEDKSYMDVLDLSLIIDQKLDAVSITGDKSIIFVDVRKKNNAYAIKGRYMIDSNRRITAKGSLVKNKKSLGTFEVLAENKNIELLTERLLKRIKEIIIAEK